MSRIKSLVSAGLIGSALMLGTIGGASANHDGDGLLGSNPNQEASNSANCIAIFSAQVTHNGQVVRGQDRQTEIKSLQATCNLANQK